MAVGAHHLTWWALPGRYDASSAIAGEVFETRYPGIASTASAATRTSLKTANARGAWEEKDIGKPVASNR
jgi:hypothetical protein